MNDDYKKRAEEEVRQSSGFLKNRPFSASENYSSNLRMTTQLLDPQVIDDTKDSLEEILKLVSDLTKNTELTAQEYSKVDTLVQNLNKNIKFFGQDQNKAVDNARALNDIIKQLDKNSNLLNKNTASAIKDFIDLHRETVDAAEAVEKSLEKSSKTFLQNLSSNANKVKSELLQLSNAFNLQKLVAGGASVESMRDIKSNVRMSLNLDNSGFMGLQNQLSEQNKQLGLYTSDMTSFLSNIKEYSFKNDKQATALYKQVTLGTKYLGMSNQSLSNLVKASNQMADNSYMERQMAILANLSADSNVSENLDSLATFLGDNSAAAKARYGNYEDMLSESVGVLSVIRSRYGDKYEGMMSNLLSDVMQNESYVGLSNDHQRLLEYLGINNSVFNQMRANNFSVYDFSNMLLQSLNNRASSSTGGTVMENFLGVSNGKDWVTLARMFGGQSSATFADIDAQIALAKNTKSTDELIQELKDRQEKTGVEKFYDNMTKRFGLDTVDWTKLLSYAQITNALLGALVGVSTISSMFSKLGGGKLAGKAAGELAGSGGSSLLAKFGGTALGQKVAGISIGNATGLSALGGVAGIATGTIMGIADAVKTKDYAHGGAVRGFFLGTGAKENDSASNTGSLLGNGGKWAAIGAGIGTFIAPGLGTAIGAVAGGGLGLLFGAVGNSLDKNTEAVEKNTKVSERQSQDTIVTRSVINELYKNRVNQSQGAGAEITYGVGSGGTSNTGGYPWRVTSPYGPRWGGFHNGMDFGIPTGTPIGAPISGKVTWTQNDPRNTWKTKDASAGTGVYMLGDDGVKYIFWHLSKLGVSAGQRVSAGSTIGLSGNTGYSSGPHLHFGTKKGSYMNPGPYATKYLFSANGSEVVDESYTPLNVDNNPIDESSSNKDAKTYISKEQVFSSLNAKGAAPSEPTSTPAYATSADVDRLIRVITELNTSQNEQREFLQALAGKNTFVYGKEY